MYDILIQTPPHCNGLSNDVIGTTASVRGAALLSDGRITGATFRVNLTKVVVNGKPQPLFARSLDTNVFLLAVITLTRPVVLTAEFAGGAALQTTVTAMLTLQSVTHRATFPTSWRRNEADLDAVGFIPIAFREWGIQGPQGYGFIWSLADHGVAEFLHVLRRG